MKPLRALFVLEHIAPQRGIASIRWTKLGKYLSKGNWAVDILTNEKSYTASYEGAARAPYDETLAGDLRYFDHYYVIGNPPALQFLYKVKHATQAARPKSGLQGNARKTNGTPDPPIWNTRRMLSKSLVTDFCFSRQFGDLSRSYDVVISSFCPYWPHMIARRMKESNPGLVWLADYRDPPTAPVFGGGRYNREFPHRCSSTADAILLVVEGEDAEFGLSDPQAPRSVVIPNGFDPDEAASRARARSDTFDLVYTGTLYSDEGGRQDLSPLFTALENLIADSRIDGDDVRILYAGASGGAFLRQAARFPGVRSENRGYVPRSEALAMQDAASGLVLCTWNTGNSQGVVTGKIYEYLSSRVPVVGLCAGEVAGSAAGAMLTRSGAGFCYEEATGDMVGLERFLEGLYLQWKGHGVTSDSRDWDYINSYGYPSIAGRLDALARELIGRRGENG